MSNDPRLDAATTGLANRWYEMQEDGFEHGWMSQLADDALKAADDWLLDVLSDDEPITMGTNNPLGFGPPRMPMVLTKRLVTMLSNGACRQPFPHEPHQATTNCADLFVRYQCNGGQ